jgi:hypothetical protein
MVYCNISAILVAIIKLENLKNKTNIKFKYIKIHKNIFGI